MLVREMDIQSISYCRTVVYRFLTVGIYLLLRFNGVTADSSAVYSPKGTTEYCEGEVFKPRCHTDEVVVIEHAVYGMPSLGKCITESHQHIGCKANVTELLGGRCSGRRFCEVRIPNDTMAAYAGCPSTFRSYLIASYTCVKAKNTCSSCSSSGFSRVSASNQSGFISSLVTAETRDDEGCGTPSCPWLIHVHPGMRINLTLYDYSPWTIEQLQQLYQTTTPQPSTAVAQQSQQQRAAYSSYSGEEYCRRLAVIKEKANPKDTNVCGSRSNRIRHLYTSISNTVEIHVTGAEVLSWESQFLIRYEALGCKDIDPPLYSRMRRKENTVEIDCPADGQAWTLRCVGNEWEGLGEVGTCAPEVHAFAPVNPHITTPAIAAAVDNEENELSVRGFWKTLTNLRSGVILTLVVAVAIIIIVLIVTSGIFCIKKRTFDKKYKTAPGIYGQACSEFEFRQDLDGAGAYLVPKGGAKTMPSKSRKPSDDLLNNTYGGADRHWESRPLPSIPRNGPRPSGEFHPNPTHPGYLPPHGNFPPNGGCPNGIPPNGVPVGGFPPGHGSFPNGKYPGGYPTCTHPNHAGYPPHPPHYMSNGYPTGNGQAPGYPQGSIPGYPGYPTGNPNLNRVTVQMHQPIHDQQQNRRSAPQGTAAVVYRGTIGPQGSTQPRRGNHPESGDHTYFVLDAEAVGDEPPAELIDPMSLPRTYNRHTGFDHSLQSGGMGSTAQSPDRFQPTSPPPMSMDRFGRPDMTPMSTGSRFNHLDEAPLITADGKCVEDVVLDPISHPGTNGKFYAVETPRKENMTGNAAPPLYDEQPMMFGKGSNSCLPGSGLRAGSEEHWPPPPAELLTKEEALNLSPRRDPQNNSLQIALRPSREGQGQAQRSSASGGLENDLLNGGFY